jgi:hypothetical protein
MTHAHQMLLQELKASYEKWLDNSGNSRTPEAVQQFLADLLACADELAVELRDDGQALTDG